MWTGCLHTVITVISVAQMRKWTAKENAFIRANPDMPPSELAATLGRSYDAVSARRSYLRYYKPKRAKTYAQQGKRFTPADIAQLRALASTANVDDIARYFGRSVISINRIAKLHGITVSRLIPPYSHPLTVKDVARFIGLTYDAVRLYIRDGHLPARSISRMENGKLGAQYAISYIDLHDLAKTEKAISWRITEDMPADLAVIVRATQARYISTEELIAAAPMVFAHRRPWQDINPRPIMLRIDHMVYYERATLYAALYQYARFIPISLVVADWLRDIVHRWHEAYVMTYELALDGIHQYYITKHIGRANSGRGVVYRENVLKYLRSINSPLVSKYIYQR